MLRLQRVGVTRPSCQFCSHPNLSHGGISGRVLARPVAVLGIALAVGVHGGRAERLVQPILGAQPVTRSGYLYVFMDAAPIRVPRCTQLSFTFRARLVFDLELEGVPGPHRKPRILA